MPIPDDVMRLLNEEPPEVSHEFEVDLSCLVTTNYKLTMGAIERAERNAMTQARESLSGETDRDTVFSILDAHENFYLDLRVAARNMALVALITRVQHWASAYARRLAPNRQGQPLKSELDFLNSELGTPPISTEYFRRLTDVRDSVIHADSQPQWTHNRPRSVDVRYVPEGYRVDIGDKDLSEAIENSIRQIKWYDERLMATRK